MRLTSEELRGVYQQETTRRQKTLQECPSAEDLLRVAAGESKARERDQLIDHLVTCSDCAEEFRLIKPFETTIPSQVGVPVFGTPRDSRARPEIEPPWSGWLLGILGGRIGYALAAVLIVVTASLGFWVTSLRRDNSGLVARLELQAAEAARAPELEKSLQQTQGQLREANRQSEQREAELAELRKNNEKLSNDVEELSGPQVNAFVADIEPADSVRGVPGTGLRTIEVPRRASLVTLILNLGSRSLPGDCTLDIVGSGGRMIFRGRGLQQSPENTFTVAVSRRLLPAGQYRLKLYTQRSGTPELVDEYAVRILYK